MVARYGIWRRCYEVVVGVDVDFSSQAQVGPDINLGDGEDENESCVVWIAIEEVVENEDRIGGQKVVNVVKEVQAMGDEGSFGMFEY